MHKPSLVISLSLFLSLAGNSFASDPSVEFFSPQGEVKVIRQVNVRFSEQMVPFGDPRIVEPFEIACPEKGTGRWADGKNWIYDFDKDLPAGVVCTFTAKPELKTLSGSKIGGNQKFSFTTGGPAIKRSNPYEGGQIDEEQVFILALDAEAKEESVLEHASCSVEGVTERIGIRIIKGNDRDELLKSQGQRFLYGLSREGAKHFPFLVVQCKQRFPNGAKMQLLWGKGIESPSGVPTSADQKLTYRVRDPFKVEFTCSRENEKADCIPILPFDLYFSAPVAREHAEMIVMRGPNNTVFRPLLSPYEAEEGDPAKKPDFVNRVIFAAPLPALTSFTIEIPRDSKDDAGRPLANANKFPLTVRTADYPPLAKFSADFGIIERADPLLPVTLRNIEAEVKARMFDAVDAKTIAEKTADGVSGALKSLFTGQVTGKARTFASETDVMVWLDKVQRKGSEQPGQQLLTNDATAGKTKEFTLPKPNGPKAFEVVGIPLKEPGFYVVELESRILGQSLFGGPQSNPYYATAAALVTNLSAHFKRGRESSLVWVTTLDKAEPVKEAQVSIRDCEGKVYWEGKTNETGVAYVNKEMPDEQKLPQCRDYRMRGYYVFARTADDMTFVRSNWEQGIESWRFNLPPAEYRGPVIGHTILDRSLLRAGETVSMKHIIRKHTMAGFSQLKNPPQAVLIRHHGSDQRYEFPLTWDENGIAETSWKIPKDAKLGTYGITLLKKASGRDKQRTAVGGYEEGDEEYFHADGWESGSFRVEEFRVPLMKGIIQPPKEALVNAREATVDLLVKYLAGGGASGAAVKLRTVVAPRQVSFDQYDDFLFANGAVKEGVESREPRHYYESEEYEGAEGEEGGWREGRKKEGPGARTRELSLDMTGALRTTITDLPKSRTPQDIQAEMEFRDPSGEVQTVSSRIPVWPSKVLVGIKPDSWVAAKDSFKFHVRVVDLTGKPLKDRGVSVDLLQRKTYSHRKRLIGGFYAYEHSTETKRLSQICEGRTDDKGLLVCESKSPVSGNVVVQARAKDNDGNESVAHQDIWIADKGQWWFDVSDNDRIDLLPERKRYEPGETAKFQVRMPFREATALVTVEREGVIETFVKKLNGNLPVIEVPVKGNHAPNVFVSALVVRGRVGDVKPTALVDLGRPAFKLGIAEINVGWRAHELRVFVTPEKQVYRIRDKARAKIKVLQRDPKNPYAPKSTEVAVAVVDEGLLELMPNKSWKLLDAMMGRRGYEVHTSTAQMQVIGKRHFGLKAFPAGGGGGRQVTREMFDTLLLWKGRVKLNDNGEAVVEIPLNDSLTSFRIAAVANAETGLFGSGEASIRTTQDLMLLSGLPPVMREGDKFRAGFTVRNTSDRKMDAEITASVTGAPFKPETRTESLAAGEARELFWDAVVPLNGDALTWEVTAKEKNGAASDRLKVTQKIVEAVQARVYQATITQIDKPYSLAVEKPRDAIPGKGGVNVSFRKKLSNGLGGVTWYMKQYPYTCMEQKVSRAIALRDESLWKQVMADLPAHFDGDGLVKYFPTCLFGSDALTAYVLAISHEAGWDIPADSKGSMLAGLRGFIEGKVIRWSALPTADVSIRKMAALEAYSRYQNAEPKLLGSITLEPNLWPTSAVIDWMNVLMRVPAIPENGKRLTEAEQILRSRLNFQGTTMGFSTEKTDYFWWLMVSVDVNAVKTVLTLLDRDAWREDMPRLVRGALGRQHRGAWSTTIANAWGVMAMEKFSKKFESVPVTGTSQIKLEDKTKTVDWLSAVEGTAVMFGWPFQQADLSVTHQGTGKPWATIQSIAAIPLKEAFSSGYKIRKTVTPVEQKKKGEWSRGDVARVKLEIESQADMTWVVVNDPVPAGSSILGSGLGGDSRLLAKDEKKTGWAWPVFTERTFTAYRAYYEFVAKGPWSLEYTVRLNTSGSFDLPETRVEALYAPEMFGEIPNAKINIGF
jgi:alpha-2-macroglobulin